MRALDANGLATDGEVIAAIQAAISLKSTYNIRVINLSLGRGIYESYTLDPLDQAVEQAWQAGIERIRLSTYPQASDFAEPSVLQPPTAEQSLAAFSHAELK